MWNCRNDWKRKRHGKFDSGLTKLEYRGYDSAGICVNDQSQQPHVVKAVGALPI